MSNVKATGSSAREGELPIPPHFDPDRAGAVWRVEYAERAREAEAWAQQHGVPTAASDKTRICLVAIDAQNTFCLPGFELFVQGKSGNGAVDDNVRLCRFIYRHLHRITEIVSTMDTHTAIQIFHPVFLVDRSGRHPAPVTPISREDVEKGVWRIDPGVAKSLEAGDHTRIEEHLLHYARQLELGRKYSLMTWPYHAMLGGIGHALVPIVEEALFFHAIARRQPTRFEIKGDNPLTEHYSVLGPEVRAAADRRELGHKNTGLTRRLLEFDAVLVAGQAKSHCVSWTIRDLLDEIATIDSDLARRVYLLEDCMSPVVVPGVVDFSDAADSAFASFRSAGVQIIRSVDPLVLR
ncbi:MAG: isochorismatase [Acidobacteriota bacterium]